MTRLNRLAAVGGVLALVLVARTGAAAPLGRGAEAAIGAAAATIT